MKLSRQLNQLIEYDKPFRIGKTVFYHLKVVEENIDSIHYKNDHCDAAVIQSGTENTFDIYHLCMVIYRNRRYFKHGAEFYIIKCAEDWIKYKSQFHENQCLNIHNWYDSKGWDDEFCDKVSKKVIELEQKKELI